MLGNSECDNPATPYDTNQVYLHQSAQKAGTVGTMLNSTAGKPPNQLQ